jgi:predicted nucleotide-binding protein
MARNVDGPPPDVDQQLVIHLFAPAVGPQSDAAYAALRQLWLGCRQFFLMRDPLPHGDLPHQMPPLYQDLPGRAETGEEAILAAQERPDADCQAFLRRQYDVLNLSVVLASPPGAPAPAPGHSSWQDLDTQWSFLSDGLTAGLVGEARLYLARSATPPGPYLDGLLPAPARVGGWTQERAATDGPLKLWEAPPWADNRPARRFVLAFGADQELHALASAWAWSNGGTAIPPLARYLLHAAKLRFLYRVWQRDATTRELTALIRSQVAAVREASLGRRSDDAAADELRRRAAEARLMAADLRELRQGVDIAEYNMSQVISSAGLLTPRGPFADDRKLAQNFLARLDDELRYLDIAAERAAEATDLAAGHEAGPAPAADQAGQPAVRETAGRSPADDITRNVFVVHGRDEQARVALFGFLEALGLHPLDWETLVAATGSTAPYLRDVIMQGIAMAQAAVVLMTPEDVVRLHPELHQADEDNHETVETMQARPNVILELGMALATYADRTIVLYAGRHRPMADLNGLNYVTLNGSGECLDKVTSRLKTAGCQLSDAPPGRRARARFRDLASYRRKPPE